jgi:hypothetical protein
VGDPPGQVSAPQQPQQASEQPAEQAAGDRIVLPDAQGQRPTDAVTGQPSPPPPAREYVEPEGVDPSLRPPEERPAEPGPRFIEDAGDTVEGDDSTGVWTRTGWS